MLRVAVGLSGGVDSAVAAWMLQRQGHHVTGIFMRNWDSTEETGKEPCPVGQDLLDARAVASRLSVDLVEVDFVKEYWHDVFVPFLEGYQQGLTPNPDLFCNKEIKFKAFHDFVRAQGFDRMATGHYCRTRAATGADQGEVHLLRGLDPGKDQSYFLALSPQLALQDTLFPLGEFRKEHIRSIAREQGLPVAEKRDSMGICFIGKRNFRSFLHQYVAPQGGYFVDVDTGVRLGEHLGWHSYTVGQRAHLGGMGGRMYVCSKDAASGDVFLCRQRDHPALHARSLLLDHGCTHWISSSGAPDSGRRLQVQIRHQGTPYPCALAPDPHPRRHPHQRGLRVVLEEGHTAWGAACGQGAVLYDGEVCLGGGIITGTTTLATG